MATLTPTASAMHEQYVKTYNKWLQQNYPDQYGNWLNKGPKRRFVGKWGSRFGALGFLYEGLKEVFDTGDIPADINEREGHRMGALKQFTIDKTPQIIYKDGLAVGFKAPKGSDVDLSRFIPYQAAKVYDEPQIPETNGETLEWIDPMDEWWPINDEHVYTKDAIREANDTGFISKTANAAKNMYDTAKYYTPPEIRQKVAETASFVSGGAYKLKD